MDDSNYEEDQRIVQEIVGRFDAPSFIRRARLVETSWADLLARLANLRRTQLEMVRLRLGQLHALAGGWELLHALISPDDVTYLQKLFAELEPRLRMPIAATSSRRALFGAVQQLRQAMEAFNRRWPKLLQKSDLRPVNDAREAYNRYYLLEKECAFGAISATRSNFKQQPMATLDDLWKEFPLLTLPELRP